MQTELIIVSEYCHKCHIEPSFIEMLEEGGLINVHTEGGEHYLLLTSTGSKMHLRQLASNASKWSTMPPNIFHAATAIPVPVSLPMLPTVQ